MTEYLRCDGFGCDERHPVEHQSLGEPSFGTGRWLGWLYLDVNRPDLFDREFRFCSVFCCLHWLERTSVQRTRPPLTPLDEAIRSPYDEFARARAGLRKL